MNMQEEIKCGFLVTEERKHLNAVFLDLLQEFERLCDRAGLTWWMHYGGLIGAVRHQGFIPWDDDIDLIMPRRDFDRLLRMTNEKFGVNAPYFLQNPVTDPGCIQSLIRFRRSDTTSIRDYDWQRIRDTSEGAPYNMGISIAIFPLDSYPRSRPVQNLQRFCSDVFQCVVYRFNRPKNEKPVSWSIARAMVRVMGTRCFVGMRHWPYHWCRKGRSGQVQSLAGLYGKQVLIWPAEDWAETIRLPFEDITVPAPAGYDRILRISYGDYMDFPPPESRVEKHGGYERWDVPYTVSVEQLRRGEIAYPGQ